MEFATIIMIATLAIKLFPEIMKSIKAMEEIIPAGKLGIVKKALIEKTVADVIATSASAFPGADLTKVQEIIPEVIGKMIDTGVSFYNMLGIFHTPKRIDPKEFGLTESHINEAKKALGTDVVPTTDKTTSNATSAKLPGALAVFIAVPLIALMMSFGSCASLKPPTPILGDSVVYEGDLGAGSGETVMRVKTACAVAIICAGADVDNDVNKVVLPKFRLMDNATGDANSVTCKGAPAPSCYEDGTVVIPLTVDDKDIAKPCIDFYLERSGMQLSEPDRDALLNNCSGKIKIDNQ